MRDAPACRPQDRFHRRARLHDHHAIWDRLDKVHAEHPDIEHPDMVLLHGGSPEDAERIAACWADTRKVPQIALKPDWTRHAKAAAFDPTKPVFRHCGECRVTGSEQAVPI